MTDRNLVEIPIDVAGGDVFTIDKSAPVRGGGSRMVPLIPTPLGNCPCIWRSHKITKGSKGQPVYEGILLASRDPPETAAFEIDVTVADKENAFPMVAVEW